MARIEKHTLKDGSVRYKAIIRRKVRGRTVLRSKRFGTRKQADRWAKRLEAKILDGRQIPTLEDEHRTLDDLIERYREDVLPSLRGKGREHRDKHLAWWADRLGSRSLRHIRRSVVHEALLKLQKGDTLRGSPASPATRNRYLAALRHALSYAVRRLEWIESNPVGKMVEKEPRGRVRFLSDDEREKLLMVCRESGNPRLYPIVVLALATGARRGESLGLRWPDVDWERQVAVLHDTKNRERRVLPLTGHALELLQKLAKVRRIDSDLIFANPAGKATFPRKAWERACDAAGIERNPRKDLQKRLEAMGVQVEVPATEEQFLELCDRHGIGPETLGFRFHDLRHSAASYLAMNGATLAEIAEVLGHKTLAMVKRYSHLTEAHTAGVVARMNEAIFPNGRAG